MLLYTITFRSPDGDIAEEFQMTPGDALERLAHYAESGWTIASATNEIIEEEAVLRAPALLTGLPRTGGALTLAYAGLAALLTGLPFTPK